MGDHWTKAGIGMMRLSHLMTGWSVLAFLVMLGCSSSDAPTTASPSPTAPFTFGSQLPSAETVEGLYVRVDRMGQPAIATAFLGKTYPYPDNTPDPSGPCTLSDSLFKSESCYRTQRDAFNRGTPSGDGDFFSLMMTGPQDRSLLRYHYELGPEIKINFSDPLFFYLKLCSSPKNKPSDLINLAIENIDITKCQSQLSDGLHLSNPILPGGSDVITYDFSKPAGWPNGRTFDDPVVDRLFAASLLDLDEATTGMTINTLVGYLNPRQDDSGTPSPAAFPHLRQAWPAAPSCDGAPAKYVRSGSEITVTCNEHGFQLGSLVVLDFTSGSGTDGVYTVTSVSDINTFTVTGSANTCGDVVNPCGYVTVSPFP